MRMFSAVVQGVMKVVRAGGRAVTFMWCAAWARPRYQRTLKRVRAKVHQGAPIRVLFLVNEPAKWKAQSVVEALQQREGYEPLVVITLADMDVGASNRDQREKLAHCVSAFEALGVPVTMGYEVATGTFLSLEQWQPDVVVYQQPWGLHPSYAPHRVAKFALTFYLPYYVANYGVLRADCGHLFHRLLFGYFVLSEAWAKAYRDFVGKGFCLAEFIPVGHPSLDKLHVAEAPRKGGEVIYAPHWSFRHPKNENWEHYSTFLWTGKAMLAYAQAHPEVKWVFRPHPTLKWALVKCGVVSVEDVEAYWSAWEALGKVSYDGPYEERFNRSSALITDCGSFLTEYACTGQPIVHLISKDDPPAVSPLLRGLYATYYQVRSLEDLSAVCDAVVLQGKDEGRVARFEALEACGLLHRKSATQAMLTYWDHLFHKP